MEPVKPMSEEELQKLKLNRWLLSEFELRLISTIRDREAQRDAALEHSRCDVCVGTGDPKTGSRCICGGSGRARDAVRHFRELYHRVTKAHENACEDNRQHEHALDLMQQRAEESERKL